MHRLQDWIAAVGRILIGFSFIGLALSKMASWDYTLNELHGTQLEKMIGRDMLPVALAFAVVFQLAGGVLVMFQSKMRLGASLLLVFMSVWIITVRERFWELSGASFIDGYEAFARDAVIIGALFLMISYDRR